ELAEAAREPLHAQRSVVRTGGGSGGGFRSSGGGNSSGGSGGSGGGSSSGGSRGSGGSGGSSSGNSDAGLSFRRALGELYEAQACVQVCGVGLLDEKASPGRRECPGLVRPALSVGAGLLRRGRQSLRRRLRPWDHPCQRGG